VFGLREKAGKKKKKKKTKEKACKCNYLVSRAVVFISWPQKAQHPKFISPIKCNSAETTFSKE
jgi:hypothetical protein